MINAARNLLACHPRLTATTASPFTQPAQLGSNNHAGQRLADISYALPIYSRSHGC